MSDVNKVILSGRLARSVEARQTPSGTTIADVRLASNRHSSDNREFTSFVRVTLWNQQADFANEKLNTGDLVLVEGTLVNDDYEKEDGERTSGRMKVDHARIKLLKKKLDKDQPKN